MLEWLWKNRKISLNGVYLVAMMMIKHFQKLDQGEKEILEETYKLFWMVIQ